MAVQASSLTSACGRGESSPGLYFGPRITNGPRSAMGAGTAEFAAFGRPKVYRCLTYGTDDRRLTVFDPTTRVSVEARNPARLFCEPCQGKEVNQRCALIRAR